MSLFKKIRRHAAVARGDFGAMFGDVEIPPLPAAVSRLVAEVNSAEPDVERLAKLLSSSPGLAAKVIKTVNSSFYGLRVPVDNVKRAVTLMGLEQVRTLSLAFATLDALPIPATEYFNHDIFWTDSLFRATMARTLARKSLPDQLEQVFTVSLLADLAIPVLLDSWSDYYLPVFAERMSSGRRLADIERDHFNWDHAQAGAWILQGWGFPDELVCCLACHTLNREELIEEGLDDSPVVPVAVASLLPSISKAKHENLQPFFLAVQTWLGFEDQELAGVLEEVRLAMADVFNLFKLPDHVATDCLDLMTEVVAGRPEREDT
ncbi:MAG: hypothetical protein BA870_08615 [Desulfuromonadales bacterium C00003094]|nr:MAG: hypothetical protein BA870_08615 [Desulfuromonadales bacterium C00003094]OEU72922.1 MAG: hypothetical protein BA869_03335 [Desulfuromonadales bacterium C00003107]